MANFIQRLHNIVGLSLTPADSSEVRLKKVALTLVPLIIGPAALVWGLTYMFLGHMLSGAIPFSYSIISALSLAYFFKTKKTQFIQFSQLSLVLILPFLLMWSLGGFAAGSMVMIWAIFAPVAAAMFMPQRAATLWFLAYLALVAISVLINDRVSASVPHLPDVMRDLFYLLNLGCGSAGLFLLLSYAFSEEKRASAESLRIAACAFETQTSLMVTDAQGVVLRVNQAFIDDSGYSAEEIVGKTPSMLKSGYHEPAFYREMWRSIAETGAWQGEIWARRRNGEIHPCWLTISAVRQDDGTITHYVGSHLDITERLASEEKIRNLASYDALTSLANRRLLMDRLKQAVAASARSGREGALLFIDLDNFKVLNDTMGHDVGDLLLQQVARRLLDCVREGDTVARLGGDEFIVMLEDLRSRPIAAAAQVEAVAVKILAALNVPYQIAAREFRNTPSIGVTVFDGQHQSVETLMKQADIAMYQAKKSGRNTVRFFDGRMQEAIDQRADLEARLHSALANGEFVLHFQVQVDSTCNAVGAEALIRWKNSNHGIVPPLHFIPLAEEIGLIVPIGRWVLDEACAQLRRWQGIEAARRLELAVNVSAKQFHHPDFVADVRDVIARHAIDPRLLRLELTESMLLENIDDAVVVMNALTGLGVRISLDDFGTGYSSLQYLKRLPLDQLKIDRAFVRDVVTDGNDRAIVRTIVAMANAMSLDVVAEGVETHEQWGLLREKGCVHFQGYYFGTPKPSEEFEAALALAI